MVRIPSEYQEVEYLESTGTQWIKTNVDVRFSMTAESDIVFTKYQESFSVGFYDYVANFRLAFNGVYSNNPEYGYSTKARYINSPNKTIKENQKYKLKTILKPNLQQAYVDDSLILESSYSKPDITIQGKIAIFGRCRGDTADYKSSAKMYNLTLSDDDELLGNFIPCYRISDNEPGMYDTVSQT